MCFQVVSCWCRSAAKCDTHCELLNTDTSPRVVASQIPSARVIISLNITYYVKELKEYEFSGNSSWFLLPDGWLSFLVGGSSLVGVKMSLRNRRKEESETRPLASPPSFPTFLPLSLSPASSLPHSPILLSPWVCSRLHLRGAVCSLLWCGAVSVA